MCVLVCACDTDPATLGKSEVEQVKQMSESVIR